MIRDLFRQPEPHDIIRERNSLHVIVSRLLVLLSSSSNLSCIGTCASAYPVLWHVLYTGKVIKLITHTHTHFLVSLIQTKDKL